MRIHDVFCGKRWAERCGRKFLTAAACSVALVASAQAALPVLQRGYDSGVSGANLAETVLNTANVAPATFGLVFKLPVDDAIFAQ